MFYMFMLMWLCFIFILKLMWLLNEQIVEHVAKKCIIVKKFGILESNSICKNSFKKLFFTNKYQWQCFRWHGEVQWHVKKQSDKLGQLKKQLILNIFDFVVKEVEEDQHACLQNLLLQLGLSQNFLQCLNWVSTMSLPHGYNINLVTSCQSH